MPLIQTGGKVTALPLNMLLDPTRNGRLLQAAISFSAFRSQPLRSAQLRR